GKSTLADRILELTNTVEKRVLKSQHLDSMSLEQERGITIKLNAVQIKYKDYLFHLIDTPGHVDFTYEVSRSLSACEGAILVVDAIQGVEAQTLANVYLAIDNNLTIIPVINKIDLPNADVDYVSNQIMDLLNVKKEEILLISAKTGQNVDLLLEEIVNKIPCPKGEVDKPLKALIFDSYFDGYRGVVIFFRIVEGQIKPNDHIKFFNSNKTFHVLEVGVKTPNEIKKNKLVAGEVGWLSASIRDAKDINIGDTITLVDNPTSDPLPGYKKLKPVVFTGFYAIDNNDFKLLKDALNKISLSDSSIYYEQEKSNALGYGFRIGCLGLLHTEILQQRLEREFDLGLIATFPSVEYEIYLKDNTSMIVSNPSALPHPTKIDYMKEPFIRANITVPNNYVGKVMELCQNKRGIFEKMDIIDQNRQTIYYLMPLAEIIFDFFDYLKSYTKGYATFDYVLIDSREANLVKVEILLNGEGIDAFAFIAHKDNAYKRAKLLCEKLKKIIPRHNFEIPVQAAINGKIIARETIKAYRKDVTAKLYGGDRTRRDKLLKKQKIGKKRSRQFGKVEIPQEAFLKVLKIDDNN
ncbi:MAG: elongation factor 4, partial [Mycoplasma sp.]|nr:elongation factor 4 [Mycoplasma sp.]